MKTPKLTLVATGSVVLLAGAALVAGVSSAAPPSPSGSASASAPPPPRLLGADIPTETSKRPEESDWKGAREVEIKRNRSGACKALVLREWLRLRCVDHVAVTLVAGDAKETRVTVSGYPGLYVEATKGRSNSVAILETPLRRGRSTIATFLTTSMGEGLAFDEEGPTIQVSWREGIADPVLVLTQPLPRRTH